MAIALGTGSPSHATGSGQNGSGGMNIVSTGCNFIVGGLGWYAGVTTDPSGASVDNLGNSLTSATKRTTATPTSVRIFYSTSASLTVSATHSWSVTGSSLFVAGNFSCWSGVNAGASVLDQETGTTATSASSIILPTLTPSEDNCLIVTMLMFEDNSAGAVSINGSFIPLDTVAFNGSANEGYAMAYLIQTTAQAVSPTWNVTTSTANLAAAMAIFKGPGGGGGGGDILMGQVMM